MTVTLNDLLGASLLGGVTIGNALLQEAMEVELAERRKNSLRTIQGLVNEATTQLENKVKCLRIRRKQEQEAAEALKEMDRAVKYFFETGNPLPYLQLTSPHYGVREFCTALGIEVPKSDAESMVVPKDWTPKDSSTVS
jgi:hypothetical protein